MKKLTKHLIALVLLILAMQTAVAEDVKLVAAARSQIGVTQQYDPQYTKLAYPNGDVAMVKGVCTDVVIRALRVAHHLDLQQLVHQDMAKNFSLYPKMWGLKKPDSNIDHRRVPNLRVYFKRHWQSFAPPFDMRGDYQAGDVVTVMLPGNLPHIMLVSDAKEKLPIEMNRNQNPLVIHNIGRGTREEASLFTYKITGHYRLPNKI
ncbi:MAG: DUF1287 domain-containing protein [Methylophilaceae bacterium]